MRKNVVVVALAFAPLLAHAQVTAWITAMQQSVGSLAVTTKQVELSKQNEASMKLSAEQAFQSTLAEAYTIDATRTTVEQFGPNGQLIDGCYQVAMATQVATTEAATTTHAATAMARLYTISDSGTASSGGIAGALGSTKVVTQFPYAASVGSRVARHQSHYCTVSEAQLGYCTLNANGMQGGDEDFSLHLQPGKTYGWDQTEAAADYVKTVAPIRPVPVAGKCSSPACVAALQARQQQESYMSMARYSFMRFTEAHSTQKTGDATQ